MSTAPRRWFLILLGIVPLLVLSPAFSVKAEVIEIDGDGGITRYDRPMVFTAVGAMPIERKTPSRIRETAAEALWPRIDLQARRHGLPPSLLRAVAWQESRGRPDALSSKGARGVMQLMPGTAAAMGVDPDDPDDNLRGGALYLRRQLDRFGSVPLALAAYNAGPGAVQRFGGVPPYRETRSYVASIMALWQPESIVAPLLALGERPAS